MKFSFGLLVLIIAMLVGIFECSEARAETNKWCGVYMQESGYSFLVMPRGDIGIGSNECSVEYFENSKKEGGVVRIRLNSSRFRSIYAKWKKFLGHVIEVKGEYGNARIENVKFVKDFGII